MRTLLILLFYTNFKRAANVINYFEQKTVASHLNLSNRILKKGGSVYISTPNVLSLKSRIRYLFTGFFYSFKPLEITNYDGLQHVASLTLDQYDYLAVKRGFKRATFAFDKRQTTSLLLMALYPLLWIMTKIKKTGNLHNQLDLLTGRIIFMKYEKNSTIGQD